MAKRVEEAFASAGLEYRVVGGLAAYLYVEERKPHAGRLTEDIDIAVRREDVPKIAMAAEREGLRYVADANRLVQVGAENRRAVQLDVQDLHRARLISPEIEADLSPILRERLAHVRASR